MSKRLTDADLVAIEEQLQAVTDSSQASVIEWAVLFEEAPDNLGRLVLEVRRLRAVEAAARECSDKALGMWDVVGATQSNPRYALALGTMEKLRAALAALDGEEVANAE